MSADFTASIIAVAADMCAMGGNSGTAAQATPHQFAVATIPRGAIWPAHRHGDAKIGVTGFELCNLVLEDEIVGDRNPRMR
jgi:hypothetical protein